MKILGIMTFLSTLLSREKCFGILWARGGLGNQLFQISALSFFSKSLNFNPLIYSGNLLSERDFFKPAYNSLLIESMFSEERPTITPSKTLEKFLKIAYWFCLRYSRNCIYDEARLKSLAGSKVQMHRLFFIQDYFEDQKYPNFLSDEVLQRLISPIAAYYHKPSLRTSSPDLFKVALHLRLTDSHNRSDSPQHLKKIKDAIENLRSEKGNIQIEVLSDDTILARKLANEHLAGYPYVLIEENKKLSAVEMLVKFSHYDCILASSSTLCWWSCYIATRLYPNETRVLSPFPPDKQYYGFTPL